MKILLYFMQTRIYIQGSKCSEKCKLFLEIEFSTQTLCCYRNAFVYMHVFLPIMVRWKFKWSKYCTVDTKIGKH